MWDGDFVCDVPAQFSSRKMEGCPEAARTCEAQNQGGAPLKSTETTPIAAMVTSFTFNGLSTAICTTYNSKKMLVPDTPTKVSIPPLKPSGGGVVYLLHFYISII